VYRITLVVFDERIQKVSSDKIKYDRMKIGNMTEQNIKK